MAACQDVSSCVPDALACFGVAESPQEQKSEEHAQARKASGLFAPHAPKEFGGLGLGHLERAFVFEEAGYSLLGPTALRRGTQMGQCYDS